MRMIRVIIAGVTGLAVLHGVSLGQAAKQSQAEVPAAQLVREVVYNELNDHQGHGYWRYWIKRHMPKETRLEDQVETAEGPVTLVALSNGQPLSPASEQQEQVRMHRLLASPEQRARHLRDYQEDEKRIGTIVALLPDAYIYDYAGDENGCHKLVFHPNPTYPAHSIEARIFHSMSGTLWVDARMKRMVRLDAHVDENLDFGYGILGRLYKGGWFQLKRVQVSPTEWKTEQLEVHMVGRAMMVKSFARETSETRGGFIPVPSGMNLTEGLELLERTEAKVQAPRPGLANASALALRP
jgi:hypothetical protein